MACIYLWNGSSGGGSATTSNNVLLALEWPVFYLRDFVIIWQPRSQGFSLLNWVGGKRRTLLDRLRMGAISLRGKVGESEPPYLVLPLTVEPTKPRLCHDARLLNLWMVDMPFSLDSLIHLPRYVGRDTYQTVLDDKSGYDHFLSTEDSREFFGIQWGGWYFVYNTLPFGWKISPYVYHSTGLGTSQ